MSRGLKDNSESIEFAVDENKRYKDDPKGEKYEIAKIDGEEYFVFVFSLFHIAFPVDEAAFFDPERIQLTLRYDYLYSHSTFNNLKITLSIQVLMVLVFLLAMYLLFP